MDHGACEAIQGCRRVVVTGGPGAGKTALLELLRRQVCERVAVLPEAASIVFGGGFPRHASEAGRRAAQRAILHVQLELERLTGEEGRVHTALCDRGTLDGLAYWPGPAAGFFEGSGTTRERELGRYAAVIHLRTPTDGLGYNHVNPLRVETAREASVIDERILTAWAGHPRRFFVESDADFLAKAARAMELVRAELPAGCGGLGR